ncbi:MAG: hypothetical protein U9N49_08270 [Campylobacterota bacterium]|nr:hypothetical protein [Campylobacterota bacterium]
MKIASYKAFQSHGRLLDKVIARLTRGQYSHTEIIFSNGQSFSISPREKKIRFKEIDFKEERWNIIELDITEEDEKKLYNYAVMLEQKTFSYDYTGAIFSIVPLCIQKANKFFCSELAVKVLNKVEAFWHLNDGCLYTPSKLNNEIEKFMKEKKRKN